MSGNILTARVDSLEYIRFLGVIRYSQCGGLECYIDKLFSKKEEFDIAIDLEQAEMLDSTALGLLARLSIEFKNSTNKKPTIFIRHGELAHVLKRVCFDQVFNIISKPKDENDLDFVELADVSKSEEEVLEFVIDAHKSLAEISDANHHYFTDITQAASCG
ncbi:MAG: hypothetical protein Q9M92_12555 [Enterobacterales bacterium]|nr:hypothetical protein [Enterobacterales bacterium]